MVDWEVRHAYMRLASLPGFCVFIGFATCQSQSVTLPYGLALAYVSFLSGIEVVKGSLSLSFEAAVSSRQYVLWCIVGVPCVFLPSATKLSGASPDSAHAQHSIGLHTPTFDHTSVHCAEPIQTSLVFQSRCSLI